MSKAKQNGKPTLDTITAVSVQGFKSIDKELELQIRPLTILAGVNSSGKSTVMQPLLLMKQTLESPSDPGPLLLNGPNVKFTQVDQMVSEVQKRAKKAQWSFGVCTVEGKWKKGRFQKSSAPPVLLTSMSEDHASGRYWITPGEHPLSADPYREMYSDAAHAGMSRMLGPTSRVIVTRARCFLESRIRLDDEGSSWITVSDTRSQHNRLVEQVIHLPGFRGNPQRSYPYLAVADRFQGTFDEYTASVIAAAQERKDEGYLNQLGDDLSELGLTWTVEATTVNDTQIELRVGRLPKAKRGSHDLVSIADVGFGVSQTLPVVVALLTAKPGQLVYIEQPEIHLHPRAQHAMAGLLVRAANRGVRVVAETHSSILLLGIQQHVAEGKLDPKNAILHWFERNEDGNSVVTPAEFDEAGAYGDWPVDFDDVSLNAQQGYLDAATRKLLKK